MALVVVLRMESLVEIVVVGCYLEMADWKLETEVKLKLVRQNCLER